MEGGGEGGGGGGELHLAERERALVAEFTIILVRCEGKSLAEKAALELRLSGGDGGGVAGKENSRVRAAQSESHMDPTCKEYTLQNDYIVCLFVVCYFAFSCSEAPAAKQSD